MCLSSFYHIFCCRSEKDYDCFLSYDLFGIALSLLAIYISGIYYAFWCHSVSDVPLISLKIANLVCISEQVLRNFYISTIVVIFMISMIMQIPRLKVKDNIKITIFVSWAAFGVIPTVHWYFAMGGSENTMVDVSCQVFSSSSHLCNILLTF